MALPFWLKRACVRTGIARYLPVAKRLSGGDTRLVNCVSDRLLAAPLEELLDPATFPQCPCADVVDLSSDLLEREASLRSCGGASSADALGLPELRDAIVDSRRGDVPEEVLITHGLRGAYASILDAFVNPGDRVVLFDPCSPLFQLGAKSRRANVRWVSTWNEEGRTRFLIAGLTRAMRGVKLLVFAQPSDPTGGQFSAGDLDEIAWLAQRHDTLVCIEKSLGRYQNDEPSTHLESLPGMARRTLSINTGYHGVGWLCGPKPLIHMAAVCAHLNAPGVSPILQAAAATEVKRARGGLEPASLQLREKRQYGFDRLKGMGLNPTWPAGGTAMWVSVESTGLDGRSFAEKALREEQVLVGPGCAYGPSGKNFVRVSFATEDGRLREGLSRLGRFVESFRQPEASVIMEKVRVAPAGEASFSRV